jgi:GNAT superfamily N-acetyltransferase
LKFRVEEFNDVFKEIEPFFQAHYDELATLKDKMPKVDPDLALFANLEAAGRWHVVTAREAGALVGYFWGVLMPHPHYKYVSMCSADAYYLAPDYRKAQNGILFIQFIEQSLKERGVQLLVMGTKMQRDLGVLYEMLHFTETDRVFRKWLQ